MRIITCTGYFGTGSSAITDYISEFVNCKAMTDYEFRFVHDPDGISDLEFALVENHNRHNSGHALKKYKKMVDFLAGNRFIKKYEPFFDYQWKKLSYEYIDALTDFSYKGYWHYDVQERGKLFYIYKRSINKILQKTIWRNKQRGLNELPREITLCSFPGEEKFLSLTQEYIDALFRIPNKENKPNIMLDQIVPPSNLVRFLRYFNDIKVFVVERDPRDIFLLTKYVWKSTALPVYDVELFCKWYKYTRAHRDTEIFNSDKVKFLYFESLIYDYENTTKEIKEFLGFTEENHTAPKTLLIPAKSVKNTRLWEQIAGCEKEMAFIEKNLTKYLFDYK